MSYKTAIGAPAPATTDTKYRQSARQLQELFPSWSSDDLQSLLHEVAGDVELAATRISEGHAEQTRFPPRAATSVADVAARAAVVVVPHEAALLLALVAAPEPPPPPPPTATLSPSPLTPPPPNANAWADAPPATDKAPDSANAWATESSDPPATTSNWGDSVDTPTPSATPSTWGGTTTASTWGDTDAAPQTKVVKTPATSKMSWAQIARQTHPAASRTSRCHRTAPPVSAPAPDPEPQETGWEEPTTVQSPSWEEEAPIIKPSTSAADVWASAPEEPAPEPLEPQPEPAPPVASPSPSIKPARQAARASARYKTIDQPVVMPSSFGSSLEKVGMQFGSLSLGEDSSEPEPAPEPQPQSPPTPPQVPASVQHHEPPPASVPPTSASLSSALFQQQGLPQQASPQVPSPQHTLSSSVSQPVVSQAPKVVPLAEALAQPAPISPALQQELNQLTPQQQANNSSSSSKQQQQQQQQHQQHLPQQSHAQHHYAQARAPDAHRSVAATDDPQHQPASAHSSYFRNEPTPATSSPYFHTATPPAGQTQDTPYARSQDYGHADGQRGFYDTYQQSAFGNRNVLGHETSRVSPARRSSRRTRGASALCRPVRAAARRARRRPAAAPRRRPQGQQGYPPPLPYHYYPYPGNQYYGGPYNSGYSVAPPFVKYPTMFPGPPGPGNAPAPGQQGQGSLGVKGGVQAQAQGQAGG
ncbi:hypothetical protein B0H14DRAFT_3532770, partial [Mycena olivaceomarginata]